MIDSPLRLELIRLNGSNVLYPVLIHKRTGIPCPMAAEWARSMLETGNQLYSENGRGPSSKRRYREGTVRTFLREIRHLYRWAEVRLIDLALRFIQLQGLTLPEIRSYKKYISLQTHVSYSEPRKLSPVTVNKRLIAAASFCSFHFKRYLEEVGDPHEFTAAEKRLLLQERHFQRMLNSPAVVESNTKPHQTLSNSAASLLCDIAHPASELNPFKSHAIRVRNYCLIRLIVEVGPRLSEPALVEISDLHEQLPVLRLKHPTPYIRNVRRDGANLKTNARDVGISDDLYKAFGYYLRTARDELLSGRVSNAMFPSHKDGKRLSSSGIANIFNTMYRKIPELRLLSLSLHVHMMRKRSSNELFDAINNDQSVTSYSMRAAALQDMMTYQFGWSANSKMPRYYAKHALMRRVRDAVRQINERTLQSNYNDKHAG